MFDSLGKEWLIDRIDKLTDHIDDITPVDFNEKNRYLPEGVTSIPGYISYDVNPFMIEILNCCDVNSPVREVNLMKGVQITYSTLLESVAFYYMAHVKTAPMMYMTADNLLAEARIEGNFLPMLNQSGFSHIIQPLDVGNKRKTGKSKEQLQFQGGGTLTPFGATMANKMRQFSILLMMKDELDAWADTVGDDGDPDKLSDARCAGYWLRRKIFRGSTPLIKANSKIYKQYKRGDQRKYNVNCLKCGFPQVLRWSGENKETGKVFGFVWEVENGMLLLESVRYLCQNCSHEHFDYDKERLFSPDHGAEWVPTATPVEPDIRSYQLPAFYSPIGFKPWSALVSDYLGAYDPETKKVKDIGEYQVFYNNVLAEPFEIRGSKIRFESVSLHRRRCYHFGEIPNGYAEKYTESKILMLTCQVDVHAKHLDVAVFGWTRGLNNFVIDYRLLCPGEDEPTCDMLESPVWGQLKEIIEETEFIGDDGTKYGIFSTVIDANWGGSYDTVCRFCSEYDSGVYPLLCVPSPRKGQKIKEFEVKTSKLGTPIYSVTVNHYKDRLAPVLRREWHDDQGKQKPYHFNAPMDMTDKQIKELTTETRKEKKDEMGNITYEWHRPNGVRNELWDLFVYGMALVEVIAWNVCVEQSELDSVVWPQFWDFIEKKLAESQ